MMVLRAVFVSACARLHCCVPLPAPARPSPATAQDLQRDCVELNGVLYEPMAGETGQEAHMVIGSLARCLLLNAQRAPRARTGSDSAEPRPGPLSARGNGSANMREERSAGGGRGPGHLRSKSAGARPSVRPLCARALMPGCLCDRACPRDAARARVQALHCTGSLKAASRSTPCLTPHPSCRCGTGSRCP